MREILFRGKDKFDGEWYVGSLSHDTKYGNCFIEVSVHQGIAEEVIPETVGQYTGLKDKTGKKIFEGDIIWDITFDPEMKENHIVMFDEGGFCTEEMFLQSYLCFDEMEVEVIGNIHDNPELLEVAEND